MGFNMRSLNSFAGGTAQGIGAGSQIANRKKLMDLETERLGLAKNEDTRANERQSLLKNADKRVNDSSAAMLALMEKHAPELYKSVFGMPEAPGEGGGSFQGSAVPTPPSFTTQATPNTQSFAQQSAGAQPAPTFGRQRTLGSSPYEWLLSGQ